MKRIFSLLALSGILFTVYFFNRTEAISEPIATNQPNLLIPKKINTKNIRNISRQIANLAPIKQTHVEVKEDEDVFDRSSIDFDSIDYKNEEAFKKLDNFYVIPKNDFRAGSYELVEKRAAFYIVKSEFPVGDDELAVVTVKGSKYLGIVTGILKVQLDDFSTRSELLVGHNSKITNEYEHIGRVFYKLNGFEEARAAYLDIKDKVPHAELEILQFERSEK